MAWRVTIRLGGGYDQENLTVLILAPFCISGSCDMLAECCGPANNNDDNNNNNNNNNDNQKAPTGMEHQTTGMHEKERR
eukprot:3454356-Amphidinium_carterae.1